MQIMKTKCIKCGKDGGRRVFGGEVFTEGDALAGECNVCARIATLYTLKGKYEREGNDVWLQQVIEELESPFMRAAINRQIEYLAKTMAERTKIEGE